MIPLYEIFKYFTKWKNNQFPVMKWTISSNRYNIYKLLSNIIFIIIIIQTPRGEWILKLIKFNTDKFTV